MRCNELQCFAGRLGGVPNNDTATICYSLDIKNATGTILRERNYASNAAALKVAAVR